jgi:hypothetical protein
MYQVQVQVILLYFGSLSGQSKRDCKMNSKLLVQVLVLVVFPPGTSTGIWIIYRETEL